MSDTFNVAHRCRGSRGSPYHSLWCSRFTRATV